MLCKTANFLLAQSQVRRRLDATVAPCQPQIVLVGKQHSPRAAILGDDHRLAQGGILAEQLDAILPFDRRDERAALLTADDVATLKHLAQQGMGENTRRASG